MLKKHFSTDRELKALKPEAKLYDVKDAKERNLMVRVGKASKNGLFRRTFVFVSRFPGAKHPTRISFGEYRTAERGDLSLEDAREKAAEWRKLIRTGVDPRVPVQAKNDSLSDVSAPDPTIKNAFEIYLSRHVVRQRKGKDSEREIRAEILPVWGDRLVADITKRDVVELIEAIADRPAPYQAHNIYGHIRTFYNWLIDRGMYDLEVSPCDRLRPSRIIGEKKPRHRVLSDNELRAFWFACDQLGYPYGPLFKLLALTGQRKNEVAHAQWSEFPILLSLKENTEETVNEVSKVGNKIWVIPAERFKSGVDHQVPLSASAIDVLANLPKFKQPKSGHYIFSTSFGEKPVNGFSKAKKRLDHYMLQHLQAATDDGAHSDVLVELKPFVIHDLRRTVRTRLSALKVSERIAEMIIGHGKKGLARIYDQHEFIDEMHDALVEWDMNLSKILSDR